MERTQYNSLDQTSLKDHRPFHANEKLIVAGQQYLLYAVAQHSGDHPNSGHYVAFIRDSQGSCFVMIAISSVQLWRKCE
jgi:uncharacterized UBP type Zn finger protein